jgi:hypothetical protein
MKLDSRNADSTANASDAEISPGSTEAPRFSGSIECQDQRISVRLVGTADFDVKEELDDFLRRMQETALARSATEVVVDFRGLTFMNSSCLKGLVTWICALQQLPAQLQYRVVLVSSPEMRWQRRSLRALWTLATDLVTIQA